ncbi:MAG: acyl carrier protein [Betaproteobacteria bacterium]|nr:acyl carrier protein [Betaproteobacteria bacterium]
MQTVALRVQQMMQEHFSLAAGQVLPDQTLADLGIDSLGAIEFMFLLEEAFGVSLSDERGELRTVSDIVAVVEKAATANEGTV